METRKYYWIKLRKDFFERDDIDFILSQEKGCEYIVLYQMLCMKASNNEGLLGTKINEMIVPYDVKKITRDCKYFDYDTIVVALELYKRLGLVYEEENKVLKITDYENLVGSETAWAEKKRIYREKQKLLRQKKDNVLEDIDKEIEIDKDIDKDIYDEDNIYTYYENNIGVLTPRQYEIINSYLNEFNKEIIKEAINRASDNNGKTYKYVEAILKSWKQKGYKTLEDIQNELRNKKDKDVPIWFNKDLDSEELDNNELQELEKEMSIFN